MTCLLFYDYFLTLGDEVRCSCLHRRRYHVLTVVQINYTWSGRRSWGEFPPPPSTRWLTRSLDSVRVVRCCTTPRIRSQVVTGLMIVLQNRYIPLLHVLYWAIMYHFTRPVSPNPRCYHDPMFTRPSLAVRFHPPYAPCVLTVDLHPSP